MSNGGHDGDAEDLDSSSSNSADTEKTESVDDNHRPAGYFLALSALDSEDIEDNPALAAMKGLGSYDTNPALAALEGVQSYESNPTLAAIEGLQSYESNPILAALEGVQSYESNPALTALKGFQSYESNPILAALEGVQSYESNPALAALKGLRSYESNPILAALGGIQSYESNPALTAMKGVGRFNSSPTLATMNAVKGTSSSPTWAAMATAGDLNAAFQPTVAQATEKISEYPHIANALFEVIGTIEEPFERRKPPVAPDEPSVREPDASDTQDEPRNGLEYPSFPRPGIPTELIRDLKVAIAGYVIRANTASADEIELSRNEWLAVSAAVGIILYSTDPATARAITGTMAAHGFFNNSD